MEGVLEAHELEPGGFLPVNANNDNGSRLTNFIPEVRDRDLSPMPVDDPDLRQITLSVQPVNIPGATARLSVEHRLRSRIKVWDTRRKDNEIVLPASWPAGSQPQTLFVEGVLESLEEREISLTLSCVGANGKVWASDTINITVTPILLELVADKTPGAAPNRGRERVQHVRFGVRLAWVLDSSKGTGARPAMLLRAKVFRRKLFGNLFIGQKVQSINALIGGGADLGGGTFKRWDWTVAGAGPYLMDTGLANRLPFYVFKNSRLGSLGDVQIRTEEDSPKLVIEDGAGGFADIMPPVAGGQTRVDVVYSFVIYAIWQFTDASAYFLGEASYWTVRFQGTLTPRAGGGFNFQPGAENGVVGTGGSFDVNNDEPPELGGPTANNGGADWQ